ncbi:hypothetical protein [Adhaeribacter radiodurans]|uniref:6-bladed beta-propeller n=1 Tax=Adhaeribacter radiodurans TaxID=2745197 RepID=A0A7L7L4M3_9BACT|nr:hypothetical protein [Adhaeribacter radiodurans]QMU27746.1 hypothetical protein HUW48_06665 [Adhaeribacter radiodurans]
MKRKKNLRVYKGLISLGLWLALVGSSKAQIIVNQRNPIIDKVSFSGVVSIDRQDNIYLTDQKNNLHKYDASGKFISTFSPPVLGHIASLEAWNTAKIFLFYDDQQSITFLDRFLAPFSTVRLGDQVDGIIKAASLASDNKIWAFNESNFSLHKIDLQFPEATRTIPLDLILPKQQYDFRFLREYQNKVFLLDKLSGIYVFDNLGTYQKRLPFSGLNYVGFRGDELYYLANNQVHFFHLYTLQERTVDLPTSQNTTTIKQVILGDANMYVINDSALTILPLK